MQAQKVHEYTTEVGPNGLPVARLGRVHNLITFIQSGKPKLHYLDGRWVDDGGNEVPDDLVPNEARVQAAAIPFQPNHSFEADVLRSCEFCQWDGAGREYATHLADKHIRPGVKIDPTPAPHTTADPDAAEPPVRLRPEELPEGNYVLDDEGFVVLNADGTPRKRAGRPARS